MKIWNNTAGTIKNWLLPDAVLWRHKSNVADGH